MDKRDRVIVIVDSDGYIGVAKDLRHAINYLISGHYIEENSMFLDRKTTRPHPLSYYMEQENFKGTWKEFLHYKIQTDISFFAGVFSFEKNVVY